MPDEAVSVTGAAELHRVYKELKAAGDGGLARELSKAIRTSTAPAKSAVAESAREVLPHRHGLASLIASSRVTTVIKRGSQSAGVQIKAVDGHDIAQIDRGTVRHPTFGHKPWKAQAVKAGWFSEPIKALAPDISKAIEEALAVTAAKVAGK